MKQTMAVLFFVLCAAAVSQTPKTCGVCVGGSGSGTNNPQVVARFQQTSTNTSRFNVAVYSGATAGIYRVTGSLVVLANQTGSDCEATVELEYTAPGGSTFQIVPMLNFNGSGSASLAIADTTYPFMTAVLPINSTSDITYSFTKAGGLCTGWSAQTNFIVERISAP